MRAFIIILCSMIVFSCDKENSANRSTASGRGIKLKKKTIDDKRRIALVIGNSDYKKVPLKNPVNDAEDMSQALASLNFNVTTKLNVSRSQMRKAIRAFGNKLKGGGVGLFYYAGHGVQVESINYLLPIGADIASEDEVIDEAVAASSVLRKMESAGNRMNMVFLDACRDNPFARSWRSTTRGLAQMDAPSGSLVVYATSPGDTAADGVGERNGVFTKFMLKYIKSPVEIRKMVQLVRIDVKDQTGSKQTPWESSSLDGDFYFFRRPEHPEKVPPEVHSPGTQDFSLEDLEKWGKRLDKMKAAHAQLMTKNLPVGIKIVAWKRFLKTFTQDNPYSQEDDQMRKHAEQRIGQLQQEKIRLDALRQKKLLEAQKLAEAQRLEEERKRLDELAESQRREAERKKREQGNISTGFTYLRQRTYSCGGQSNRVKEYRHNQTGMEFVLIPGGSFDMGSNENSDEKPVHRVTMSSFLMAKTEVTNKQYMQFVRSTRSNHPEWAESGNSYNIKTGSIDLYKKHGTRLTDDNSPVVGVSWNNAVAFCKWAGFRLPTEAEWEYACRSGTNTKYYWGDSMNSAYCWYKDNSSKTMHPVGQKDPNAFGLYDMSGNVYEWCQDWYDSKYYASSPQHNPTGPSTGSRRVYRGGGWNGSADDCRSARRDYNSPGGRLSGRGFRPLSPVP